jgi:hypothetical protein
MPPEQRAGIVAHYRGRGHPPRRPKTVTRWADSGRLTSLRTLGGHRRYREAEVRMLLANDQNPANTQSR